MGPKLNLLLALALVSILFMSVLLSQKPAPAVACEKQLPCKKACCKGAVPAKDSGGGDEDEMFNGSFNHLIVSTIR